MSTPDTDRLFAKVRDDGAIVPAIWRPELANVLLQAEKRGRISLAQSIRRLCHSGDRRSAIPAPTSPPT